MPREQRYATRPEIARIMKGEGKEAIDKAIYLAHVEFGYTLIAPFMTIFSSHRR